VRLLPPVRCQVNELTELAELRRRYWDFAEFEAKDYSPIYWSFATAVAENDRVLERLAVLPRIKQQPNLLLAAVRLQHGVAGDADEFCNLVIRHWDEIEAVMLAQSTQTNEPARCAILLPVLAGLSQPISLFEVGTSAGLCLFPDKYAYDYGQVKLSPTEGNPPIFGCRVNSKTPVPSKLPQISWRGGIDLRPLSVANEQDMNWLRLLVWPEHTGRLANLDRAIQVAQGCPPQIVEGDLLTNLEVLASEMPHDATPVVFHSAVLAYLPRPARERFMSIVVDLDVTWISNEHPSVFPGILSKINSDVPNDRFLLSVNGDPVAMTGPHGQSADWL
jgi:hypothetical protein